MFFALTLIAAIINLFRAVRSEGLNHDMIYVICVVTGPAVFMVVFMVKMSFRKWSALTEEEQKLGVTFMDMEVAQGWYDFFLPDFSFRFRDFKNNVP